MSGATTSGLHNNQYTPQVCLTKRQRQPRAGLKGGRHRSYSLAERVAARTVRSSEPDGCWTWQGCRVGRNGYGQIMLDAQSRKLDYAHRVAWALANGPIPDGMVVCHRCDNPRCVNPSHLFLGSQRENIHDAVRKGRWTVRKLSDDDVEAIRALAASGTLHRDIARAFHVARNTISSIVSRRARTERIEPLLHAVETLEVHPPRPFELPNGAFQVVPSVQVPIVSGD